MVDFSISQIGALILHRNFKLSNLLESKVMGAPSNADIWHLRCRKEELLTLQKALAERLTRIQLRSAPLAKLGCLA